MKYHGFRAFLTLSTLPVLFSFLTITGCRTVEEPAPPQLIQPEPEPEPLPEQIPEPQALDMDWPGTTWIVPDPQNGSPKDFPGYRGFYLGRDGKLLLINQDDAAGNVWSVEGNRISLSILEGSPELLPEGTFFIFPGKDNQSIRLVPESDISSEGITLNRGKANVDIVENHWIPRRLKGGETVIWPANREIHLMLLPDTSGMGILGYGGENRFHGSIQLGEEAFRIGPIAITRRYGPASEFENLYVQRLSEAERFVQVGDDLYLYAGTIPVAAFRVRLFD